jgi:UTP-glucose-1-phosphate uridylyltransferase
LKPVIRVKDLEPLPELNLNPAALAVAVGRYVISKDSFQLLERAVRVAAQVE